MTKQLATFLSALIILSVSSCRMESAKSGITSGRIDYRITYLNNDLDKRMQNILPSRMRLLFNEKQASNNIEGFMGMYKLNAFTNFNTRKCSTILKVLDKHYFFKGSRDESMCCFDPMDGMIIKETEETKQIAGFLCKRALVTLPSSGDTFSIYYTNEITLRHPNATNPYKEIKGVLMEFELQLLHLKMRFVADKYTKLEGEIECKPEKTSKEVSRNQMTQILNKLMD